MSDQAFHLGFCMAGSVSAGAYTAGVLDYLIEALRAWEEAKKAPGSIDIPKHDLKIDLLCGTSGGGISAAMALFAMQDSRLEHCRLNDDRKTYNKVKNNIFWNSWVEMSGDDIFYQMLATGDLQKGYVPSALNADFIDKIAANFEQYVLQLAKQGATHPRYLCDEAELFLTLFNVTGIRYSLFTIAAGSSGQQYVSEHRDIAHFGWHKDYKAGLGRMEMTLEKKNMDKHLKVLVNAAKATGAFPGGLKGRKIAREAKYVWENPFFNYDKKFTKNHIHLGNCVEKDNDLYLSINADGGTANNEPIELAQDVMSSIREHHYKHPKPECLLNSTVILIDPFPSLGGSVTRPKYRAEHLATHLGGVVGAMRSQLLFDAKRALDAYRKTNYGLHLIAPSRDGIENQEHAIACGALGGFGGFLDREFRVHDYFLGRHNCQSFLRKYLVVDLNETGEDEECVKVILDSYRNNPAAVARFKRVDKETGITWVPILPEVSVTSPEDIEKKLNTLPTYDLAKRSEDFLEQFRNGLMDRYTTVLTSFLDGPWWQSALMYIGGRLTRKKAVSAVIDHIGDDLKIRKLMHGKAKAESEHEENCADMSPFDGMD